jgi:hypothetical protein
MTADWRKVTSPPGPNILSMVPDRTVPATVEVYVRSLSPDGSPTQQALFDQLNALSREGVIDYWTVHVVGKEVCPETATSTEPGQFICERIQQFKEWAAEEDVSFGSFFERRRVSSEMTGEEYDTVVLPSVTLAEFDREGALQFVTPCFVEGQQVTPSARLDELLEGSDDDAELAMSSR